MARHRATPEPIDTPADWDDATDWLHRIGRLDREIAAEEAKLTEAIADLKRLYADRVRPHQEERRRRLTGLEQFADRHAADFGKRKSRELASGLIGWRRSTRILQRKGWKVLDTLGALKAQGLTHCIKTRETIDKDTCRTTLDDDTLQSVGLQRDITDIFFVEPVEAAIPEEPRA